MAGNIGYGSSLSNKSTGSHVPLDNLEDVVPPEASVTDVEVTTHSSASATKEFIAGLIEPGECGFTVLYTPGAETLLRSLLRVSTEWKHTLPTADVQTFNGYLKKISRPTPLGDKVVIGGAIKVSGPVVFTPD